MARRRKNQMAFEPMRFTFNAATGDDFPVRLYMLKYARRLTGKVEMTNDFLEWLLALLGTGTRKEIIRKLFEMIKYKRRDAHNDIKPYHKDKKEFNEYIHEELKLASLMNGMLEDEDYKLSRIDFEKFIIKRLEEAYIKERQRTGKRYFERLEELCRIFALDDEELELLCFLFCLYGINSNKMNCLVNEFSYADFIRFTSIAVNIPAGNVRRKIGRNGRMGRNGFFKDIDTRRNDFYEIHETIVDFICGVSNKTISDRYVKGDGKKALEMSSFNLPVRDMDTVVSLLKSGKPCNILLYGTAGTGKTEFARSVIRAAGLEPRFLQYGEDDDYFSRRRDDDTNRMLALKVGVNTLDTEKAVLVVDEADFLLNSRYRFYNVQDAPEKGWMNDFLEKTRAKIVWITNETGFMEESTQRRFSYSIRFREFTMTERSKVFGNLLKRHPLRKYIDVKTVEALCDEYHVNAGGIVSALEILGTLFAETKPDGDSVGKALRDLLGKHEELIHGREHMDREKLAKIAGQYDPSLLHTDTEMGGLERSLSAFVERLKEPGNDERIGMNLLFWGIPGTGKTEYAKYLAKAMKKKLLVKRYSDLVSMWVGETEQNIAAAFREAEKNGAILFIDEADSFFTSRESAQRSWEVSRTNEFLTQIENHRGILICCTNLLPNMDRAAMRRFNWKIEFRALRKGDRAVMYERYFPGKEHALSTEMRARVEGIDGLTPGDLRAVWNRNRFLDGKDFDHGRIIGELEKEVKYRNPEKGRVGF